MATWQLGGIPNLGINQYPQINQVSTEALMSAQNRGADLALKNIEAENQAERERQQQWVSLIDKAGQTWGDYKKQQEQERFAAFNAQIGQKFADGDRDGVIELIKQNLQYWQHGRAAMGIIDQQTADDISRFSGQVRAAIATGNQDAINASLAANARTIQRLFGLTPEQAAEFIQKDPQGAQKMLDSMAFYSDPTGFIEERGKADQRAETSRHNQAAEALTARGQDVQIRGQDLSYSAQMARLNHDKNVFNYSQRQIEQAGRMGDMDVHDLNAQIVKTGMDPLTRKPATAARQRAAQKWMDGNDNYNNSLINAERDMEKIDSLLKQDELSGVGRFAGNVPDFATSEQGMSNRNAIEELKAGSFTQNVQLLRGMGSLSNAEGQKLENLIAKLDYTQPEGTVRKQLEQIKTQYSTLQRVAEREANTMGYISDGYDTYVSERKSEREKTSSQGNTMTSKNGIKFKVK